MYLLGQTVERRRRRRHTGKLLYGWHHPIEKDHPSWIEESIQGVGAGLGEVFDGDRESRNARRLNSFVAALRVDVLDDDRYTERPGVNRFGDWYGRNVAAERLGDLG